MLMHHRSGVFLSTDFIISTLRDFHIIHYIIIATMPYLVLSSEFSDDILFKQIVVSFQQNRTTMHCLNTLEKNYLNKLFLFIFQVRKINGCNSKCLFVDFLVFWVSMVQLSDSQTYLQPHYGNGVFSNVYIPFSWITLRG